MRKIATPSLLAKAREALASGAGAVPLAPLALPSTSHASTPRFD